MQSKEDAAAGRFCAAGTLNGAVLHCEEYASATKTGRERSLGAWVHAGELRPLCRNPKFSRLCTIPVPDCTSAACNIVSLFSQQLETALSPRSAAAKEDLRRPSSANDPRSGCSTVVLAASGWDCHQAGEGQ